MAMKRILYLLFRDLAIAIMPFHAPKICVEHVFKRKWLIICLQFAMLRP
jgi:hypothetical protein